MGIRLTLAVGYGMQLTKEQLEALDQEEAERKMERYIDKKLEESMDFKRNVTIEQMTDEDYEKSLTYLEYHEFLDEKRVGSEPYYLKPKYHDIGRIIDEIFSIPRDEVGTDSFIGFLEAQRHDDSIDYVVAEMLGNPSFKNFEIPLPVDVFVAKVLGKKPRSIEIHVPLELGGIHEIEQDGKTYYIPKTGSTILHETLKKRIEAGKEGLDIFFTSKEECLRETVIMAKENAWIESMYYARGLELVRVLYPDTTMEDIEKYLVGWWS